MTSPSTTGPASRIGPTVRIGIVAAETALDFFMEKRLQDFSEHAQKAFKPTAADS